MPDKEPWVAESREGRGCDASLPRSPRCKRSPKEWQEPSKGTQAVLSGPRQPACKEGRAQASVSAFTTVDPRTGLSTDAGSDRPGSRSEPGSRFLKI